MATNPLPILQSLQGTGTPAGISGIRELANGCAKKYWLNKDSEDTDSLGSGALQIGTIAHALLARYYDSQDQRWAASAIKYTSTSTVDPECRREAERIFKAYRIRFPPNELGKVVGVEYSLPEKVNSEWNFETVQARTVGEAVGIYPYSCQIDLAVDIKAKDVKRLRATRKLHLTKPGLYLVDHKTASSYGNAAMEKYIHDVQFTAYMMAWNAAYPEKQCKGMLVNVLIKTKEPRFETILVPPPNKKSKAIVRKIANRASIYIKNNYQAPNPDRCFDWGRSCKYLRSGECQRS